MKTPIVVAALIAAMAMPALAEEIGVHAGPVGAGVTVGEPHRDHYRDHYRDHKTTVIKEREPKADHDTVIKERGTGMDHDTVIRHDRD